MERVLLLGVDTPIGLAVLRDLGKSGHRVTAFGSEAGAIGLASRYCDRACVQRGSGEVLVQQLIDEARGSINYLVLTNESAINLANAHRERLGAHMRLLCPDAGAMEQVLDKGRTLDLAAQLGIDTPRSHPIDPAQPIAGQIAAVRFPVVLKWPNPHRVSARLAAAGLPLRKMQYCLDAPSLQQALARYRVVGEFPLVQEYCAGHGLGQFFLCREGEVLLRFQHERVNEWPPEGGASTLCRAVRLDRHVACRQRSEALLRRLDWSGVAMVEYRFDPAAGRYHLMEINGRFWGSLPLAEAADVRFASALVEALGRGGRPPAVDYREVSCRYLLPDTKRLLRILFRPSSIDDPTLRFSRSRELLRFLGTFLDPRCRYFVFQFADPGPWLRDLRNMLSKLLRRA